MLLFVVMIVLSSILFSSFFDEAKREAVGNANKVQMVYAAQAARGIEDFINGWINTLTILSESEHVSQMTSHGREEMRLLYKSNQDNLRAITRVDASGKIIYTYPEIPGAIGSDISKQKHIREIVLTHKPVLSDVFTSVQGYDTVALHVPVFRNKAFAGSLAITVNFQALAQRYLEGIKVGDTGYAWMISRDGTELYCPVPGHTGKSVFENARDFPSILAMAEDMLRGNQGTAVYYFDQVGGSHLEPIKKHAVYMPIRIADTFWSIAIATSEDEIVTSLEGFRNKLILVVISLLFVGLLSGYYGIRVWLIIRKEEKRRLTEKALRQSESKLAGIIEFLPDATFVIDLEGRVVAWNRAIEDMTGISKEDIIGKGGYIYTIPFYGMPRKNLIDIIEADDRELESKYDNSQRKHNLIHAEAFAPALYDGRGAYIFAAAAPIFDEQGNRIGSVESIRDITERKKEEEAKQMLEVRLQRMEKMEALGTLAGGVAHDLNNVLGIIVGYAELLLHDMGKSDPLRQRISNILAAGERSAAIVQDLLTLARRGVPNRETLNLNKIITDLEKAPEFEKLRSQHPSVTILRDLSSDLLNISGSPVHLSKSLYNLVLNACEAMPDAGVLSIKTFNQYLDNPIYGYDEVREGDYVVLSVSDTGEGITENDLGHIFEPFYTKKVMGKSGTGLGLSVVWGTVKDHDGYINVVSEHGKGSTFALYFPVVREGVSAVKAAVSVSEYIGKEETIMVVDDVLGQRKLAVAMLERLNYKVVTASSGEEAIEYLKTGRVDLIVLDMIMDSGMDGLDTYRKVLEIYPGQKAVVVSGFSESERVTAAQKLGAGDYVRKPYILERLGMAVRKELDRK
jgi:signal transduction histidine kinase/ActR/RegA family two-component response regulator